MTLSTAQQIRLRIQDYPRLADATYYGDGTATAFLLPHRNLTTASAYVPLGGTAWSATGATFDITGNVAFANVISANSAWRARYAYSVFSDDEIDTWTTAGGTVNGAALEAVQTLMFDGLKRASWAAPDGSKYDDTKALESLAAIYSTLKRELGEAAVSEGSIESWSLNQELY